MRSTIQRLFLYTTTGVKGFTAVLDNVIVGANSNTAYYVLFVGAKVFETNESWCIDCRNADPILDKAFELFLSENTDKSIHLLVCDVARDEYRKPDFPFRLDPRIKLTCVPTLIKYSAKSHNEIGRLNDSQCQQSEWGQVRGAVSCVSPDQ